MKTADVLRERMTRQGLATRVLGEAADAARIGVALQAQDLQASRLGVRARVTGTSEAAVATACDVERSVVRTWLMRSTVHLVPAADAQWMAALFGSMISRRFAKRWSELGLSAEVLDAAAAAVPDVLGGEALNRHELVAALRQLGIHVDPDGQAPSHLVLFTSTIGLTCRGPDRGRETTFVLAESWLPSSSTGLSGDKALAELARRYFTAFSPATGADFTTWSGLASGHAISLIRDELRPVDVEGRRGWTIGAVEGVRAVRLLPAFDNYVLGYRHRDELLDPSLRPHVYEGSMIRPTVVVDGKIVATWKLARRAGAAQVTVAPFATLTRAVRALIDAETREIGVFIGLPVSLTFAP